MVHFDQDRFGANTRKPSRWMTSKNSYALAQRLLGIYMSRDNESAQGALDGGLQEDGTYASAGSEEYTPELCLAFARLALGPKTQDAEETADGDAGSTAAYEVPPSIEAATDEPSAAPPGPADTAKPPAVPPNVDAAAGEPSAAAPEPAETAKTPVQPEAEPSASADDPPDSFPSGTPVHVLWGKDEFLGVVLATKVDRGKRSSARARPDRVILVRYPADGQAHWHSLRRAVVRRAEATELTQLQVEAVDALCRIDPRVLTRPPAMGTAGIKLRTLDAAAVSEALGVLNRDVVELTKDSALRRHAAFADALATAAEQEVASADGLPSDLAGTPLDPNKDAMQVLDGDVCAAAVVSDVGPTRG